MKKYIVQNYFHLLLYLFFESDFHLISFFPLLAFKSKKSCESSRTMKGYLNYVSKE